MKTTHVEGEPCGTVLIYALSTCGWCRKTKALLNELAVAYDYVDVDLLTGDDRTAVMAEIEKWNPSRSFPTLVINGSRCIIGFQPDKIKQAVGK